jgi:hypothetical protein
MLGRQAYLLTYHTERPPTLGRRAADRPAQVLLTIDAATYALLDVALIPQGAAESSALHPIQAQQFEVLDTVPDDRFQLAASAEVSRQTGLASVRFPFIGDEQFLTLEDAARHTSRALLAPSQLPDARMRGLAIAINNGRDNREVALLYEGEFQNVLLLPDSALGDSRGAGEERSAGDFRYQIVRSPDIGGLTAIVYRPELPDERLMLILNDEYATSEEREATLRSMIASLTPVDERSLPALRGNFAPPGAAAGGS